MTDDDRWQTLAAEFLRKLARRDMRVWKARSTGQAALDDEDLPAPTKWVGSMKRLHLKGFQKPLPK